jgi:hypothetical protein
MQGAGGNPSDYPPRGGFCFGASTTERMSLSGMGYVKSRSPAVRLDRLVALLIHEV